MNSIQLRSTLRSCRVFQNINTRYMINGRVHSLQTQTLNINLASIGLHSSSTKMFWSSTDHRTSQNVHQEKFQSVYVQQCSIAKLYIKRVWALLFGVSLPKL
ncbi:hypothetical protein J437_LFUL003402 [Ladona fulva]|uniref:Uncharacterized protein n=1 Tax=Ladona fulva TaxID=123851 RepID=A0A8K0NYX7_LADFU|nr:hypothetical protein J437_LFUL003402 [Ladona fulva]